MADPDRIDTVPQLPLAKRLQYGSFLFALKNVLFAPALIKQSATEYIYPRACTIKTYSRRMHLPIRIFFPASYARDSGAKLPTLFTIHGGGFVLGAPRDADDWNEAFANQHGMLVVSLNYSKAPGSPFPGPLEDLEALFHAALGDADLPIDDARIAVAGFSAGGSLTLSLAQLDSVRPHVRAVVPIYPVLDFSVRPTTKQRLRRYKKGLDAFRDKDEDFLQALAPVFNWAYLPPGHATNDPLLSPLYAPAEKLPEHVFIVACELDMLGHEAWRLASRLAGRQVPGMSEVTGQAEKGAPGELILDDERFHFEARNKGKRVRWLLVPDEIHGFDLNPAAMVGDNPVLIEDAQAKAKKCVTLIGKWLLAEDGPFASTRGQSV